MSELAESSLWHDRANWSRGWRAVGGCLYLTPSDLVFVPNSVERSLGEKTAAWARASLTGVDLAAPTFRNPFSGAMRTRLRFSMDDGDLFFVVPDPRFTLQVVSAALNQREAP